MGDFTYLENIVYHFFRQQCMVLGGKLMEIHSNGCFPGTSKGCILGWNHPLIRSPLIHPLLSKGTSKWSLKSRPFCRPSATRGGNSFPSEWGNHLQKMVGDLVPKVSKCFQVILGLQDSYPPGNDHIFHQNGSSENHRLKVPAGMRYLSSQEGNGRFTWK